MTSHRIAAVVTAACATLALAACTDQVGGQANPSPAGHGETNTSAPPSGNPDNPFASLNPCSLLDQALTDAGFPPAVPTVADAKESCAANKPRAGDVHPVDLALSLQPGRGYRNNVGNPGQASEGKVNGRAAVEEREPQQSPGQCGIWLEVKPASRALVLVTSGSDTANACKLVEGFAEKIEPLLPKTN
ncbi:DUF3558 domain-containing protein [Amycolatopsis balhimycina DSM 5908]|uniref:DUF3558 domain-containing protein n=1 Tax=Amycolatopsis balhimycina DSM 5908 TaxID=1081091 RepID=A0A428WIV5_AMYBA|nr:DUF3558 family protein [Amycolatopsis balhimycina]RSM43007.1 DUF3558 domain-containing protein [Amycolatopsis balhimycina DSM 5908]